MGDRACDAGAWIGRVSWVVFVMAALALAAGYVRDAGAWAIVEAPNHDRTEAPVLRPPAEVTRAFRAEVGPPAATLEAWILDPATPPRGTVLVLHGIRGDKRAMVGVGRALRDRGMRAVLVDLRGHGASSGRWLTYGVVESRDLRQLIDHLEALGVAEGPIGVYGASYGGAAALQLAAIDPRVEAVVSLSTFSSLREVVPPHARRALPGLGALLPTALFDAMVDTSGELGGFSPDAADTTRAIAQTGARVLLLHGREDRHVPFEQARALMTACRPGRCDLVALDGMDHPGALGSDRAGAEAVGFLTRHLRPGPTGPERGVP